MSSSILHRRAKPLIRSYFSARASLRDHFGFIEVSAGGSRVAIDLNPDKRGVGIGFEAPRHSLMTCITNEFFDDMLIGNYMRTTLHNVGSLSIPTLPLMLPNMRIMEEPKVNRIW